VKVFKTLQTSSAVEVIVRVTSHFSTKIFFNFTILLFISGLFILLGTIGKVEALGAPIFDTTTTNTDYVGPDTTMTASHTVTGTNRLLMVAVDYGGTDYASSVTYNGVSLSIVCQPSTPNGVELWYLLNPDLGTHDVVVDWPSDTYSTSIAASSFLNVDTADPFGESACTLHDGGETNAPYVTLNTNSHSILFGAAEQYLALFPDPGVTETWYITTQYRQFNGGFMQGIDGEQTLRWTDGDAYGFATSGVTINGTGLNVAIGNSQILPGAINAGVIPKQVIKTDGFPLLEYGTVNYYNSYFVSCQDEDCSTNITTIDPGGFFWGQYGYLWEKANGKAAYAFTDFYNERGVSVVNCADSDCTDATYTQSIVPVSGGSYYGPTVGAMRSEGSPLLVMDGSLGNGQIVDVYDCADPDCLSGFKHTILEGITGPINASVVANADDQGIIAYRDEANNDFKIFVCIDSGCAGGTTRTIDTGAHVGDTSAIMMLVGDIPAISYGTPEGLKYYLCGDSTCSTGYGNLIGGTKSGGLSSYTGMTMQFGDMINFNPIIETSQADGRTGDGMINIYICYSTACDEGRYRTLHQLPTSTFTEGSLQMRSDGGYIIPFTDVGLGKTRLYDRLPTESSQIINLNAGLQVRQLSRQNPLLSLTGAFPNPQDDNYSTAIVRARLQLTDGTPISDTTILFPEDGDLDWGMVTMDSDNILGKSFVANFSNAPGAAATHSLYIPRIAGTSGVHICPNAYFMSDVSSTCPGGYDLSANASNISIVSVQGNEYWLVTGLTGTGGMSISTAFNVKDVLTRLQVSTESDHTIYFGTINGLLASGDTIAVEFAPGGFDWDLSTITVGDIDLLDNGTTSLTLAASPGVNTWGVNINTGTDTITFTAPASGTGYIPAGDQIVIKIGLNASGGANQIVNPVTVNSYEIHITNTNGVGTETGEVEIPIIDDDTVNVTGYIDTFISFDLDTADTNINCDAAGGGNPCDSYAGATDNSGYVVDLGEMNTSSVTSSGSSVLHADSNTGNVNSIWFDLSSNSSAGAVVTAYSLNNALQGPGGSTIPSVGSGQVQITAGSSLYGLQNRVLDIKSTVSGELTINTDCTATSGDAYFCSVGGTAGREIFNTSGATLDTGRVQFRVGASPNSLNATGTYTDELTFIATATF
jgi:hypothetical protein